MLKGSGVGVGDGVAVLVGVLVGVLVAVLVAVLVTVAVGCTGVAVDVAVGVATNGPASEKPPSPEHPKKIVSATDVRSIGTKGRAPRKSLGNMVRSL